jgi:hypothetical protein
MFIVAKFVEILILTRKPLVDPVELLPLIHYVDKTAEFRVFGLEQGMEFEQGGAIGLGGDTIFEVYGIVFVNPLTLPELLKLISDKFKVN